MERIKRFLLDDTATAEASSTVIMIAAVGVLLAAGLAAYYTGLNGFFGTVGNGAQSAATNFNWGGGS